MKTDVDLGFRTTEKKSMTTNPKQIPAIMNQKEFASLLGKSQTFVSILLKKGMGDAAIISSNNVQGSDISIDVRRALQWYAQHRTDSVEETARSLLLRQQERKAKMLNDKMAGKLVPIETIRSAIAKYCAIASQEWEAFPLRVTTDEVIQEAIRAAVIVIRNNITQRCQNLHGLAPDAGDSP